MILKSQEGDLFVVARNPLADDRGNPYLWVMPARDLFWSNLEDWDSYAYQCGHCGNKVGSIRGLRGYDPRNPSVALAKVCICHECRFPTFIDLQEDKQYPGVIFGEAISDLPSDVMELYDEARRCMSINAHTSAAICCRKLLMNIAVQKGADIGREKTFAYYVGYLMDNHYVPTDAKEWVDAIRDVGNDANHEIWSATKDDAENVILFVGMLLRSIFQYPAIAKRRKPPKKSP